MSDKDNNIDFDIEIILNAELLNINRKIIESAILGLLFEDNIMSSTSIVMSIFGDDNAYNINFKNILDVMKAKLLKIDINNATAHKQMMNIIKDSITLEYPDLAGSNNRDKQNWRFLDAFVRICENYNVVVKRKISMKKLSNIATRQIHNAGDPYDDSDLL